jgi:dimethylhistidine N-methyltransferase
MPIAPKAQRRPQAGEDDEFAVAVIAGLSSPRKNLPCRFFYDARGSDLFEEITHLPEYYPTRTETAILEAHAAEMAQGVAGGGVLIEFGSGSSRKTEILLARSPQLFAYVSIDVSASALDEARQRLAAHFPALALYPIVGDFSRPVALPADLAGRAKTGFFPGSTVGNFAPEDAIRLLHVMRATVSPAGRLIVGIDLKKDARTLVAAYDDAAGVTAAFNLNLLARINRELDASFDLASFRHKAIYDPREGRIEMHLVSTRAQEIRVAGRRFRFAAGETIHTENSYKYSIPQFQNLARAAGWHPHHVWTDADALFSVHELSAT